MDAIFCGKFYRRIEQDPEIRALTVSEAMEARPGPAEARGNFSCVVDQREFRRVDRPRAKTCARGICCEMRAKRTNASAQRATGLRRRRASSTTERKRAYEALLAAEGSDWYWWYGPEHGSANDAEFDELYRKHLTEVYFALGEPVPTRWLIRSSVRAERAPARGAQSYLDVNVDGRESNYFEWLGAGLYSTDQRGGTMHGRSCVLGNLLFTDLASKRFYLRVDPVAEAIAEIPDFQLRLTLWDSRETRITVRVEKGKFAGCVWSRAGRACCIPRPWCPRRTKKLSRWASRANCSI